MSVEQSLTLTFTKDVAKDFLHSVEFQLDADAESITDLKEKLGNKNTVRAICILLVLAKYRGILVSDKRGIIPFKVKESKRTWINTAANRLEINGADEFASILDPSCIPFAVGDRGDTYKKVNNGIYPSVAFDFRSLPLENLKIFRKQTLGEDSNAEELKGDDLAKLAEDLEHFEVTMTEAWDKVMPVVLDNIKLDWSRSPRKPLKLRSGQTSGCPENVWLTPSWKDLFSFEGDPGKIIAERLKKPQRGEFWYILSVSPTKFTGWKDEFENAVENFNVTVKWIVNSPEAGGECPSMAAHWQMLYSYLYDPKDILKKVPRRMRHDIEHVRSWVPEKRRSSASGTYEFYQSKLVHHFMGILLTPFDLEKLDCIPIDLVNTMCCLQLYPMFPQDLPLRCGLLMSGPSKMLEIYFHSFLKFFEKDGEKSFKLLDKMPD